MKKIILISGVIFVAGILYAQNYRTFHDFEVYDIYEDVFDLARLEGKKVLVVNTASKCGLTPQYEELQSLYEEYGGDNFTIIGFPANNFNEQEPGTNEEIAQFCQINYGVSFPMMSKISVRGEDIHPLYRWLTSKAENGKLDTEVSWNFQKFMIDENGKLVGFVPPRENPRSEKIIGWINGS